MLQLCFYYAACLVWDLCYQKKYHASAVEVLKELEFIKVHVPTEAETPEECHAYLLERITAHLRRKCGKPIDPRDDIARLILPDYKQVAGEPKRQTLLIGGQMDSELGQVAVTLSFSQNQLHFIVSPVDDFRDDPYFAFESTQGEQTYRVRTKTAEYQVLEPVVKDFMGRLYGWVFADQQKLLEHWFPKLQTPSFT